MTPEGAWIVRRWVVLAADSELDESQVARVGARLYEMWLGRHPETVSDSLSIAAHGLIEIGSPSVPSVSQLVNTCVSPLDPVDDLHWWSLRSRLNLPERPERSVASLAQDYRAAADEIPFDRLNSLNETPVKREELEMSESGHHFWFAIDHAHGGARLRFTPPEACIPFMEYAVTMKGRDQFKALPARRTSGEHWQRLIDEAGALRMDTVGFPGGRPAASALSRK